MEKYSNNGLKISIFINIGIVIFEIIFGLLSQSMALISDALHNLTDVGSMILSLWGEKVSSRPKTKQKTYGYKRAEIIVAFVNSSVLLGMTGWLLLESTLRILHPKSVAGSTMFIVATVALLGNGLATYILEKDSNNNLNLKSAWMHSLQDALFSLAVVISAIVIYYTGWSWMDPTISIIVSIFLLKEVYEILSESVAMLLDSVPSDLDFEKVRDNLLALSGVKDVRDLHIWQTGSNDRFLSAHVEIENLENERRNELLYSIQNDLAVKFNIDHPTIQMVSADEIEKKRFKCNHCN
jgi:cobalt-zinc-cadmium efflux system protein